ncbi:hypothetical protein REPUB_Repub06bG0007400 [Reevesia pubescens]
MERKGCCSKSYVSTPKKETVVVTPKKEEFVKPEIVKGNVQAAPAPATAAVEKTPKIEEKETDNVKKEPVKVVEFKVRLHCKACEKAVRKSLLKINGVKCVEIDMGLSKITVLGYVDRKAVAKAIHKTGRRAEAWPSISATCRREDYFSPRLPKGFRCIIPRCGFQKFEK